jgi:hypothetical protein
MNIPIRSVFKTIIFPALYRVNIRLVIVDLYDESIFYPLLFETHPLVYWFEHAFDSAFPRQSQSAFKFFTEAAIL